MKATTTLVIALAVACLASCLVIPRTYAQSADADIAGATTQPEQTTPKDQEDGASADNDGETSDEEKPKDFWMEQKLRLSKGILTGLVSSDFEVIGKNAEIMRGLNRVEAFVRRRTEGYRDQFKQFDMANQALIRASQEENLDGATLAFNQLMISCVKCHKHLREQE